jgi:hypothetical protein
MERELAAREVNNCILNLPSLVPVQVEPVQVNKVDRIRKLRQAIKLKRKNYKGIRGAKNIKDMRLKMHGNSKKWRVYTPEGEVVVTNLSKYCKDNNLKYSTVFCGGRGYFAEALGE